MKELIIAVDVEADGPIPGINSMISLGAAAYKIEKGEYELLDTFSMNLVMLSGAGQNAQTMKWWRDYQEAWKINRQNQKDPKEVMEKFNQWVVSFGKNIVFASWPATFDFMFAYWYLMKFVGSSPFEYSGIDVKSYALAVLKSDSWLDFSDEKLPKEWLPEKIPIPEHVALNDAVWEGEKVCRIILANLK